MASSVHLLAFLFFTLLSFPYASMAVLPNPRLLRAYEALQAWKEVISSDPKNVTANWVGHDVCSYTGIFCAPAIDDNCTMVVAGIDLNHKNIAGSLPEALGLLTDLALFHINSNRFCGSVDLSNNQLTGEFPRPVLSLPSLKFLDIRFNQFEGQLPSEVFDLKLDALFVNNNKFVTKIPENIGNSPVSVLVIANNNIKGCLPKSIGKLIRVEELLLLNNSLTSCIPEEIGQLKNLTVLDLGYNEFVGPLPETIGYLKRLEQLNIAHNKLSGEIPEGICELPRLRNFTFSYNYFYGEPWSCLKLPRCDDSKNCLHYRPHQRTFEECEAFLSHHIDCGSVSCDGTYLPPPPAPAPYYFPWRP